MQSFIQNVHSYILNQRDAHIGLNMTLFLVADTRLYTLPCRSVCRYVGHIFELRAVFALLPLPNRPRLDCRVSGRVSSSINSGLHRRRLMVETWLRSILPRVYLWWKGFKPGFSPFHHKESESELRVLPTEAQGELISTPSSSHFNSRRVNLNYGSFTFHLKGSEPELQVLPINTNYRSFMFQHKENETEFWILFTSTQSEF